MLPHPVFIGRYQQRGYGVPSLFLRTLKPVLRRIGVSALKHGAKLGARVAVDMSKGKKIGDSLKHRAKQSIQEIINTKTTLPHKRPAHTVKASHSATRPTRRKPLKREKDIFDK